MPRSLQSPKGKPYTQRGSNLLAEPEAGGASAQALVQRIRGFLTTLTSGFPGGSVIKHPPAQAGDVGLIPGSGRSPREGNGNPLQYSCLDNPVDRGAWRAAVHGVTQSRTRLKQFSMHACIGEGNGNPLQYSCLEIPRDKGAWWATVSGVTQSWTRLKRLSSSRV